jgi:hypothetical protein
MSLASVTPLTELKEVWRLIFVGQENFPQLDHRLRAALMNMPMGIGLRAIFFLDSPADWLLNPMSLDALVGNVVPQPSFADVAEPPPLTLPNGASAAQFAHKTGGQLAVRNFDVQQPLPEEKTLGQHVYLDASTVTQHHGLCVQEAGLS